MNLRLPASAWAYLTLALLFCGANLLDWPYTGPPAPRISVSINPNQTFGGLLEQGLWQINHTSLKSSINRLPAVRTLREIGNSVRLLLGQRVKWIIWGNGTPLMLFGTIELPVSCGLDPQVEHNLTRVAEIIAGYGKRLSTEGWTLIVLPIPTKLGIYRDFVDWPIYDGDLISRRPIEKDRSDEFYAFFNERLRDFQVSQVDLDTIYRRRLKEHPESMLFAPNDSHWAGDGILLAAQATADVIAHISPLRSRMPVRPTFLNVTHVGDLAKAHDVWPGLTTWLRPAWTFEDRLLNGEETIGYTYASNPIGLIAVVGTSYTGQYTWLENQPVGFSWQLSLHMENVEVQNHPMAGQGSFFSFERFWRIRHEIAADFEVAHGSGKPKVVVWEFPIRDVMVILGQPTLP